MPYLEAKLTAKLHRIYGIRGETTIGRSPDNSVQLLSRAVSRRHALVEVEGESIRIRDMGAANGVKVNGERVDKNGVRELADGDRLRIGGVDMVYRQGELGVSRGEAIDLRQAVAPEVLAAAVESADVSFLLPADAEELREFQGTVARERIAKSGLTGEAEFRMRIALKEAIDNAEVHGCHSDPTRTITVTFQEDAEDLVISVRDDGPGYEVESRLSGVDELDAFEAIRNRAELGPGLGLRIILDCVDRIHFEGDGSCIHMAKFKEGEGLVILTE